MKNKELTVTSVILVLCSAGLFQYANAQTTSNKGLGITADLGIPFGLGISGSYSILPEKLNARARYNFGYDFDVGDKTSNGFKVKPELKFSTFGVFADWFPTDGGFRVTGGLGYMGDTKIEANGTKASSTAVSVNQSGNTVNIVYEGKTYQVDATKTYTIDGVTYRWNNGAINDGTNDVLTTSEIGNILDTANVKAEVKWNDVAPYLGIGYANAAKSSGGWSFNAEMGIYYVGNPKITATASANCSGTADDDACRALVQEMNTQADEAINEVRSDLNKAKVLPYLSLGVAYSF